ncbi:hypothetical protein Tco_1254084 [Tanacetum coccineum]
MAHMEFYDKHNMVAFLQKPTGSEQFHQIVDFLADSHIRYALTATPTIYVSLIEQFWQTAIVKTINDGEQQITIIVDEHNFAITEASVRRHLQLAYVDEKILIEASTEKIKTYKKRQRSSKVGTAEGTAKGTAKGIFSTTEDIQGINEEIARKVQEEEQAKAIEQQEQKRLDLEVAKELQRQLDQGQETDDIDWSTIVEQNMAGYKMSNFKGMTYDQIKLIFEKEYNKVQTLFQKDSEVEPIQEHSTSEPKELPEEDLKKMVEIIPVEEFKAEIIRVSNITEAFQSFEDMLKAFDRENLDTLWRFVKEKLTSAEPVEDMEKALWVELKRLYEPDKDDTLWKLQRYIHDPLIWRLYGSCAVHHVSSTRGHDIFMLIEKDYPLTTAVMVLMLGRSLQVEEYSEMARDLIRKIFREANNPRS